MLARIYIEALLTDENLADQVWELWGAGVITDEVAAWAWWLMATDLGGQDSNGADSYTSLMALVGLYFPYFQ